MYTQEELFNRFGMLAKKYQRLGSIVQNDGQTVTHEELDQFEKDLNRTLSEMRKMSHHVVAHYQRENKII